MKMIKSQPAILFLIWLFLTMATSNLQAQLGVINKGKNLLNKTSALKDGTETSTDNKSEVNDNFEKRVNTATQKTSIFFTSQKTGNESTFKMTFTEGEYIYAHLILDKPISEYAENNIIYFDFESYEDGNSQGSLNFVNVDVSKMDQTATVLDFDIIPDPKKASTLFNNDMIPSMHIESEISTIKDGENLNYIVKLKELTGSFSIQLNKQATFKPWIDESRLASRSIIDNADAANTIMPVEFSQPSNTFKDPELSREKILSHLPADCKLIKMVIGPGNDYKVETNEWGIILSKKTDRYIKVVYKDLSDGFCYVDDWEFKRPYEGNGQYGDLIFNCFGGRIDCNNVK